MGDAALTSLTCSEKLQAHPNIARCEDDIAALNFGRCTVMRHVRKPLGSERARSSRFGVEWPGRRGGRSVQDLVSASADQVGASGRRPMLIYVKVFESCSFLKCTILRGQEQ